MKSNIQVYHFHHGSEGGVFSVIKNLLKFKQHENIEHHVIYLINTDIKDKYIVTDIEGAATQQIFYYSSKWNFFYISQQLAKLFPKHAVLIAHDWLELGMISNLGLQNKVIFFLHGDYSYYYDLAVRHQEVIDEYICIADSIKDQLSNLLPHQKKQIHYLRFPVGDLVPFDKEKAVSKIAFVGRGEKSKGYNLLPRIAEGLYVENIQFEWGIFGEINKDCIGIKWPTHSSVDFYGQLEQDQMLQELGSYDYIILPSLAEGMPLAIVEAMKLGVIPIVNNIPGGLQEIVLNGETGYLVDHNNIEAYISILKHLESDLTKKKIIKKKAIQLANLLFNSKINTQLIENVFLNHQTKLKRSSKIYLNRLDQKWIPNTVTCFFRHYFNGR